MKTGIVDINGFYHYIDCGVYDGMDEFDKEDFYQFVTDEWMFRVRVAQEVMLMVVEE